MRQLALLLLTAAAAASGVTVRQPALSTDVDEASCVARKPSASFRPVDRQIFFSFVARDVAAGDRLRMEWVTPSNAIADSADYRDLPAAPALCFITQLPVSGFPASSQAGTWTVRVVVAEREVGRYPFTMEAEQGSGRVRVGNLTRSPRDLVLDGSGFEATSVVHIAEYRRDGGWRYIHSLLPAAATPNRLTVSVPTLPPGEYIAIVKNSDDSTSQPSRFLVSSGNGYQLPLAPGEKWLITQGPYGGFSHWRNSLHAYDIAPRSGQWVAAMRGGTVRTHDVGAVQSHARRTFGNYITIQHDDGEFSHYAHLATGTFRVRTGEWVEAGQILARVGNSGYTLGEGGGYHVHVHVTRTESASAPSIPFRFIEFPDVAVTALKNREVMASGVPVVVARATPPGVNGDRRTGKVTVAGTWSGVVTVPSASRSLELVLGWLRKDQDVDLRIVSPSGRQYGALGDITGYSGEKTNPKRFRIQDPETGIWLVIAAGMKGGGEAIDFTLDTAVAPPEKRQPVRRPRAKRPSLGN